MPSLMNVLDINGLPPRWGFVNLFYDATQSTYHCRLRHFALGTPLLKQLELTASGATMQIAFDNVSEEARHAIRV